MFLGVGGGIHGKINPDLVLYQDERAQINLINGEGAEHDVVVDLYGVRSDRIVGKGASATIFLSPTKSASSPILLGSWASGSRHSGQAKGRARPKYGRCASSS